MAGLEGLKPPTKRVETANSVQLSYSPMINHKFVFRRLSIAVVSFHGNEPIVVATPVMQSLKSPVAPGEPG